MKKAHSVVMVTVGSVIVTSHGLARVVSVTPGHNQNARLQEKDAQAIPLSAGLAGDRSGMDEEGNVAEENAAAFTQAYLLSIDPDDTTDPLARAKAEASLDLYRTHKHHAKPSGSAGNEQVIDVKT